MSMYFLDDTDDWPEYHTVRDEIRRLESSRAQIVEALRQTGDYPAPGCADGHSNERVIQLEDALRNVDEKLHESMSMYR